MRVTQRIRMPCLLFFILAALMSALSGTGLRGLPVGAARMDIAASAITLQPPNARVGAARTTQRTLSARDRSTEAITLEIL